MKTVSLLLFTVFTVHSVNLPRNLSDDLWFIVHCTQCSQRNIEERKHSVNLFLQEWFYMFSKKLRLCEQSTSIPV